MAVCDLVNLLSGQPVDSVWHPELIKMRDGVSVSAAGEPICDMEMIEAFFTCAGDARVHHAASFSTCCFRIRD